MNNRSRIQLFTNSIRFNHQLGVSFLPPRQSFQDSHSDHRHELLPVFFTLFACCLPAPVLPKHFLKGWNSWRTIKKCLGHTGGRTSIQEPGHGRKGEKNQDQVLWEVQGFIFLWHSPLETDKLFSYQFKIICILYHKCFAASIVGHPSFSEVITQ